MAPFPIIDLLVAGFELCFPGAHIDHLQLPTGLLLFRTLRATVAEQQKTAGLCSAKVKGDRSCLLSVPLGQGNVGLGGLKGYRVQGCHVLTSEHQIAIQGDFGVTLNG
uniref:Uncharacterized protein n=1 Tax=Acanthochromis polyacanthus TaxID=80966 RepID=A0A3Q1G860_9TELE